VEIKVDWDKVDAKLKEECGIDDYDHMIDELRTDRESVRKRVEDAVLRIRMWAPMEIESPAGLVQLSVQAVTLDGETELMDPSDDDLAYYMMTGDNGFNDIDVYMTETR
jgi:hypothetical protein